MSRSFTIFTVVALLSVATYASQSADSCLNQADQTTFTAADGCNTCTCINQSAVCTETACVDPAAEPQEIQCLMTQRQISAVPYLPFCAASLDASLQSLLQPEFVGCVDLNANCIMLEEYGMSPDGRIYHFDSCLPEDFVPVDVDCAEQYQPKKKEDYHQISINGACTAEQVPILAIEKVTYCSNDATNSVKSVVGCRDKSAMCLSVVTFAHDASGHEFVFSDSCIPSSFIQTHDSCQAPSCPADQITIFGTPLDMYCSGQIGLEDEEVVIGCSKEKICPEMITYAQRPSGEKYAVHTTCLPEGFQVIEGSCGAITCLANQKAITAKPFEETCTHSSVELVTVGCMEANVMCAQAITYATDNFGKLYVFSSACVPSRFTIVTEQPSCQVLTGCVAGQRPLTAMSASSFCSVGAEATIETVGCIQSNILCASLPVFAVSPAGAVYYFPVGCVPMGFTIINASCQDITAGESCVASTHAVTASPMANYCSDSTAAPKIAVGCVEDGSICTEAVTFAQNSQGQIYVFADGCIPAGFSVVGEQCAAACPNGFKSVEAVSVDDFCWSETVEDFSHVSFVGCVEEHTNCLMVETFAREKQSGEAYVFETGCVPSNYEILESVQSCHDMACYGNTCTQDGRVCQERVVECLTYPCPPETYCAESMCVGHEVYQEFVNDCGADCSCDEQGTATCGECEDKDESEASDWDAKVIAAGSVGVAAASAAVFVGYRKYFHHHVRHFSFRSKPTYSTMHEEATV